MTPAETQTKLPIATDPMLANIDFDKEGPCELVYIYGFIGKVTEETVRLHQGLNICIYYEIPRSGIVHCEATASIEGPATKLVVYGNTRLTYVSTGKATLPASSLAAVIAARDRKYQGPVPSCNCDVSCCINGHCKCAPKDYWFRISKEKAKKLDVQIICPPSPPCVI